MAHELAHVQNRDTLTMTITATLAGAISMLGNFAFFFGGNRDNNNALGFIGVLVAMIVAPLAATMVQMAISRTREYSADRRGAEICGNPLWLASALDKIARNAATHPQPGRRAQSGHRAYVHHQSAVTASAWTICSRPIRPPRTASPPCRRWRARHGRRAVRRRAAPTPAHGTAARCRPVRPRAEARGADDPIPWGRNPTGPRGRRS